MEDEQLLQFTPEQARQQLNDSQLERYNELKKDQLEGNIESKKTGDAVGVGDGLQALREAAEEDITVEVHGIEFLADIQPEQVSKLGKVAQFEDRNVDSLNPGELESIRSNILDVLAELSVNHDRKSWQENFGDAGLVTLGKITGELLDRIDDRLGKKKVR